MKKCHNCLILKKEEDFSRNKSKKDGLSSTCKECMKSFRRIHYSNNRGKIVQEVANRRKQLKELIWEYKATHACVDCGEEDPIVLDFDHIHNKKIGISEMPSKGYSWSAILSEIRKCEIVCSNCHRRRTFRRNNMRV